MREDLGGDRADAALERGRRADAVPQRCVGGVTGRRSGFGEEWSRPGGELPTTPDPHAFRRTLSADRCRVGRRTSSSTISFKERHMSHVDAQEVARRMQIDFLEWPMLRVTLRQACRLWNAPHDVCEAALVSLVRAEFLFDRDGMFHR